MSTHRIITNNTVLSNLACVDSLDLLQDLYEDRLCTSLQVADEIREGVRCGYSFLSGAQRHLTTESDDGWIQVLSVQGPDEQSPYPELHQFLDAGEAECLALAITRGFMFATDDKAARRYAKRQRVALTGTLGILIQSVRREMLTLQQANTHLQEMIRQRYRSPVNQLDDWV